MKTVILCLSLLFLSGCFYQDVPSYVIDKGNEICKEKGGIYEVTSWFDDRYTITCQDGTSKILR